jgi:hypothetical protein
MDWALAVTTLTFNWMLGWFKGVWWTWLLVAFNATAWIFYSYFTDQLGFVALSIATLIMAAASMYKRLKERETKEIQEIKSASGTEWVKKTRLEESMQRFVNRLNLHMDVWNVSHKRSADMHVDFLLAAIEASEDTMRITMNEEGYTMHVDVSLRQVKESPDVRQLADIVFDELADRFYDGL